MPKANTVSDTPRRIQSHRRIGQTSVNERQMAHPTHTRIFKFMYSIALTGV
ncbi:hypothetical protein IQ238_20785 [Pleurocapsales cyanobacterium LEGE 06147]|nr:hypothetical protein [Pleurocapsales cyanobacterium LEGE 06147]